MRNGLGIPLPVGLAGIEEDGIVDARPLALALSALSSPPDNFVAKVVLAEDLIEHDLDVVGGVPVAVVVEAAGFLEDAVEVLAAGAHVVDVGAGGFVAVFEGAFFLGLAPEDFVVAVGVEGGIDVDEVHALGGEFGELFEVVAAVDDAGVDQR